MDLLQGLRAALRALANPKLFAGGMQLAADDKFSMPSPPSRAIFQRHFNVVFLDMHGWNNFAANIARSQLAEVRGAFTVCAWSGLAMDKVSDR